MSFFSDVWASMKSTWNKIWGATKKLASQIGIKVIGPILAIVVVVGGFLLLTMGFKELQIGGVLGKLLGKKGDVPKKAVDIANTVDKDRVGSDGKLIQPGTTDAKGMTQAVVVPIKEPGLFSDPKKVEFVAPGETKPTKIELPEGVTNKDVEHVVVIKPEVVAVTVKDKSGISAQKIDDLLTKYGGVN
jgi:hypothetical protein